MAPPDCAFPENEIQSIRRKSEGSKSVANRRCGTPHKTEPARTQCAAQPCAQRPLQTCWCVQRLMFSPDRPQRMNWKNNLSGRKERRLPIMVVVRLAALERESGESHEQAHTDNISPHGVRVLSTRPWQPGQRAEIIPADEQTPIRGEVVYCRRVDNDRFFVGFKFSNSRLPWSITAEV